MEGKRERGNTQKKEKAERCEERGRERGIYQRNPKSRKEIERARETKKKEENGRIKAERKRSSSSIDNAGEQHQEKIRSSEEQKARQIQANVKRK
jgi:hypothetical protein